MAKNYVCLNLYLKNRLSYDCDFWCICKITISPFFLKKNLIFQVFRGRGRGWVGKSTKNDPKLPISIHHVLYPRNCRSFLVRRCKIMISSGIFVLIFTKKYSIVNIKLFTFFIGPLQQYF